MRCWCPTRLSDSPYGFVIAGADIRHVPLTPGVDFFAELEKRDQGFLAAPKMLVLNFPANPTTQCVDLDFFEKVVAIAREHKIYVVHDLAYADLVFDGYQAPSIMQVPGPRTSRRILHAVEELQHARLAYRLHGRQSGSGQRAGADEVLSRLRHVHADSGGRHRRAGRPAGLRGRDPRHVPASAATCCATACTPSAGRWKSPRPRCSCGRRFPSRTASWARWNSASSCWPKAKVAVSPGIGFGEYGDDHVRFA
jgi:alanine-synthesizing transaminase